MLINPNSKIKLYEEVFGTPEVANVVDLQDNIISKAPRDYVHNNLLMHRSSHVLLFNFQDELFLQRFSWVLLLVESKTINYKTFNANILHTLDVSIHSQPIRSI
mgnify:CR=1 FL=1